MVRCGRPWSNRLPDIRDKILLTGPWLEIIDGVYKDLVRLEDKEPPYLITVVP